MTSPGTTSPLGSLRNLLAVAFVLGVLGTGAELILLDHRESIPQWIPLVLLGVSLPAIALARVRSSPKVLMLFRGLMFLFIASGFLGLWFHYRGSVEFQQETSPSLTGFELFVKAIRSKAPPALAPGTMIELGLVGLALAFRHPPARDRNGRLESTPET